MTGKRHFRSIISFFSFFVFFTLVTIGGANARVVASDSTIIDRLNKRLGVSIPAEFGAKLLDFVLNDTIMRTRSATAYTEEFIINEMEQDWGINKQNQLLFIRSKIYGGISQKKLYNRLDDENIERAGEYKKVLRQIANSYEAYKKGFKIYMEMGISENDSLTAQYRRESAENDKEGIEAIYGGLDNMIRFYNNYKKNPNNIKPEEIKQAKALAKRIIDNCKYYHIDYKAKLSKEIRDFFDIE